jgi:hypothetical protein
LRAAVQLANVLSLQTSEGVTVNMPAGTSTDTLGTVTIAKDAQIRLVGVGANASIIDGAHAGSVVTVERGASLTVPRQDTVIVKILARTQPERRSQVHIFTIPAP